MRVLATLLALTFFLVGCGGSDPWPTGNPVSADHLSYPELGISAPVEPTGLNSKGELAVPPITEPEEIVRLNWAPEIAEGRPEIIASHVSGRDENGQAIPGGFFDLKDAKPGDRFTLDREYTVREVMTVDKDDFPTGKVYDPREGDWAVLITCGGELNTAERSYEDNVLVFAEAT